MAAGDGVGRKACGACNHVDERNSVEAEVWRHDHWRISVTRPSGAPLILRLSPKTHHDFTTLPKDRAAESGQIMVALGAAIEALPSVARVHVNKWGDGGAQAHIFFARPTRMPQLRGTRWRSGTTSFLVSRLRFATRTLAPSYTIWSGRTADTPSGAQRDPPHLRHRAPAAAR